MMKLTLFLLIVSLLLSGPVGAESLQGKFRGDEEFASYLLNRGEEFWEELRGIFRVRPSTPVQITFYDGRLDYLQNKPPPSAPESIDALLLYNRIHFILEKRRPYSNEMVLYHELVHIFQREFYSLTPHNVWFSDIQTEYLVGLHFFGPEYHEHLRQNLNFNPEEIRGRLGRDMDWRYNRALGLVVMDYLLDRYRLKPDLMHQLVITLQSENLLHRHQQVISGALDYMEEREDIYSFIARDDFASLPLTRGIIPTPVTFTRAKSSFIFHSFYLEGTYHSLAQYDLENDSFSPYIISENYLDWPTLAGDNNIYYVRRNGGSFEIILGNSQDPAKEVVFNSPQYLSNLHYDPLTAIIYFGKDEGPHRHLFSLDKKGELKTIAGGPFQNWSPFPGDNSRVYFLSNRQDPRKVPGGDLYFYQEGTVTPLTENQRFLEILDREESKLLLKFIYPQTGAEALGIFETRTGNWEKTITRLPSTPYFPHLSDGEIIFWQSPFSPAAK